MTKPTETQLQLLNLVAAAGSLDHDAAGLDPFCDPEATGRDVFNECHHAGWLKSTHDFDADFAIVALTPAGRAQTLTTDQAQHLEWLANRQSLPKDLGERALAQLRSLGLVIMDRDAGSSGAGDWTGISLSGEGILVARALAPKLPEEDRAFASLTNASEWWAVFGWRSFAFRYGPYTAEEAGAIMTKALSENIAVNIIGNCGREFDWDLASDLAPRLVVKRMKKARVVL